MIRVLFLFFFFYSNAYCVECLPEKGKLSRNYNRILKNIENDDFNRKTEDSDYKDLIVKLKEINSNIALLEKIIFK